MDSEQSNLTSVQIRTRLAILDGAAEVLARNRAATLPEIAAGAAVGRTTLHRYFPDRETLVQETTVAAVSTLMRVLDEAALDQGSVREAMRRTIDGCLSIAAHVLYLFGDSAVVLNLETALHPDDTVILALIQRGQRDGTFSQSYTVEWIEAVLFALIRLGCQALLDGTIAKHLVSPLVVTTFENAFCPALEGNLYE